VIAEIPLWKTEVLVKANYGDKEFDYGFKGISERADTSPIGEFYISSEAIYIFDRFQSNVKIYDFSGGFIQTISTRWPISKRKVGISCSDILVHEGVIYMLNESGSIPPEGESVVKIYTFDLESGNPMELIRIYNTEIGRAKSSKAYRANSTHLRIGPNNGVWIHDGTKNMSFPIARNGKPVPKSEHMEGIRGELRGSKRIIYNRKTRSKELYDSNGKMIRVAVKIKSNTWKSLKNFYGSVYSRDCEYFLVPGEGDNERIVVKLNGQQIGRVLLEPKRSWATYSPQSPLQFDSKGRLYRIYAERDSVCLYRWAK
jgi:hypothetical protein